MKPVKSRKFTKLPLFLEAPVHLIGRQRGDTQIPDALCSRRHAVVYRGPDGAFRIKDLGSANGTYVNGRRVRHSTIRSGDRIRIGRSILIVVAEPFILPS